MQLTDEQLERVAALCHEQWSGWIEYQFDRAEHGVFGDLVIPKWAVTRWTRQMDTEYEDLPENEKKSDRKEARKFVALFAEMMEETHGQDDED